MQNRNTSPPVNIPADVTTIAAGFDSNDTIPWAIRGIAMPIAQTPIQKLTARGPVNNNSQDWREASVNEKRDTINAKSTAASRTVRIVANLQSHGEMVLCAGKKIASKPRITATPVESDETMNNTASHGVYQKSMDTITENSTPV